ncbi:SAM-dependent methyltransferase [Helicobacter didelphidarum]|uniref:SAM-dependent methyltransferase n=1 Tax=Helicobacter didelphidarum TaxID=2040648 RepID=A0A3D8IP39_9HELI|nr:class I SAM-dependent methyltransferase [Helicobacter didelphidarum]RDU66685.1 SAM-dependent methyltransferase [Helicobacter didelphidarum]
MNKQNYYGNLCTQMYEILHEKAPSDELDFYLSYAKKSDKILEPLCGSGRFLIPFLQRGFDIMGIDNSCEMLERLRQKAPNANVIHGEIMHHTFYHQFDYIFIPSGSISLFTDMNLCKQILSHLKGLLTSGGRLVFAVDTIACQCEDDIDYKPSLAVKTQEGYDLIAKTKNFYDTTSKTQFSPSVYELYDGATLLESQYMDFQTHLYELGEMEQCLKEIGFDKVMIYSSFAKEQAINNECENFIYECRL